MKRLEWCLNTVLNSKSSDTLSADRTEIYERKEATQYNIDRGIIGDMKTPSIVTRNVSSRISNAGENRKFSELHWIDVKTLEDHKSDKIVTCINRNPVHLDRDMISLTSQGKSQAAENMYQTVSNHERSNSIERNKLPTLAEVDIQYPDNANTSVLTTEIDHLSQSFSLSNISMNIGTFPDISENMVNSSWKTEISSWSKCNQLSRDRFVQNEIATSSSHNDLKN